MKLIEHVQQLIHILKTVPGAAEFDLVYSSDDEGNTFQKVHYGPTVGKFTLEFPPTGEGEFDDNVKPEERNAVCIN